MAKISGRFPKMTSPEFFISIDRSGGIHSKFAAPMPSNRPATGSTATGNISDLPIFCKNAKGFNAMVDLRRFFRRRNQSPRLTSIQPTPRIGFRT